MLNSFIKQNLWDEARVFYTTTSLSIGKVIPEPKIVAIQNEQVGTDELKIYHNEKRQLKNL